MRIHLQTPTLHCRDALSVRNFSNFQAAFDPTNWDHQLIARNPPEPHWRQMNHEPWNPMAAMCIWKNAILQLHSKFTEIPEKWLGIVILEHLEPLLMNQGITYGRMLREWGDSIPMLPDMPVDDYWKIPGTPGQGSDRPRKSWFPVMNGLVLYVFFFQKIRKSCFFPHQTRGFPADFSFKQIWNSHDSETRISNQHRNDRAGNAYQTRFLCDHFLWNQLCLSSTTIQSEQSKCSVASYRFRTVSSCSKALHVICISLLQCKWSTSFL